MNQLSVNPSRRTHFSTSYYINSKQYSNHKRKTSFFHGENDGSPHARQHRIKGMKFQMCPVTYPRKPRKPTFQGLTGGHRMTRCDRIRPGASNTTSEAVYLPVSKVFSCPKFKVLDVGRAYPQGWPQRFGVVTRPHVHSADLVSQRMVSEFPEGIKTMTTITRATAHTTTPTLGNTSPLARQQAIENALSMALYHVRHGDSQQGIHAATGRAIRATSLLKQACAEFAIEGSAA